MKLYILNIVLLIIVHSNLLKAQKILEGEYEFGLISFISSEMPDTASTEYKAIKSSIENQEGLRIAYTTNAIAFKKNDDSRKVMDFGKKITFEFNEIGGEKYYFKDTLTNILLEIGGIPDDFKNKLNEPVFLESYKFGLDCWKYEMNEQGTTVQFVVSSQLAMPKLRSVEPDSLLSSTIVEIIMKDSLGNILILGITSFKPQITNPDFFSIDTSGFKNRNIRRDELQGFGDYQNDLINKELLQKLVDNGVIDKEDLSIKIALDSDKSYDIPSILLLGKGSKSGFQFMSRTELLNVFKKNEILTPTLELVLSQNSPQWDSLTSDIRFTAVCVAAIKDHLNKTETKKQISENLQMMKYGDFASNQLVQQFVNGNVSYEEFLNEVSLLEKLRDGIIIDDEQLFKVLEDFFNVALGTAYLNHTYSKKGAIFKIRVNSEVYIININDLKQIDYDYYENDQPVYKDTIQIEEAFYYLLLNTLKQIGADNNLGMAYSILHLEPPFTHTLDTYDYKEMIRVFPQISIDIDALYLNVFKKDYYDPSANVGTSFPFHPSGYEEQIELPNMKIGDIDAGLDYISTKTKREFLQFAETNDVELTISEENLNYTKIQIYTRLYKDPFELIQLFDNIRLNLQRFNMNPQDISTKKSFKSVYPLIYDFFNGKCSNWYVKKNPTKNESVIETPEGDFVFRSKKELLEKILKRLNMAHINVHKLQRLASFNTEYFLVTNEQEKALNNLFGTALF